MEEAARPSHSLQVAEVVEALKSTNINVVNKAFQNKWFFQHSNDFVNAEFFLSNIFPFISMQTRSRIIKVLSRSLKKDNEKAKDFFNCLSDLYGLEQAKPFLFCCNKEFLLQTILKYEIELPERILNALFEKYPGIVCQYLLHELKTYSSDYKNFFPKLLKNNADLLITLIGHEDVKNLKCGRAAIRSLSKNNPNILVKNAQIFITSPYLVMVASRYLSEKDFEKMYYNLLEDKKKNFSIFKALKYLKYCLKGKRLDLLIKVFCQKYSDNLLNTLTYDVIKNGLKFLSDLLSTQEFEIVYKHIFKKPETKFQINNMMDCLDYYPRENRLDCMLKTYQLNHNKNLLEEVHFAFLKCEKLLVLLPTDKNIVIVNKIMHLYEKNSEKYFKWVCCLPPNLSFVIFKEAIKNSSDPDERRKYFAKMIYSCKLHDSQLYLLEFLKYYCSQYINEKNYAVLREVANNFKIEELNDSCWLIFYEILRRLFIKDELPLLRKVKGKSTKESAIDACRATRRLLANIELSIEKILVVSVHRSLIQNDEKTISNDKSTLDKVIDFCLKYLFEIKPNFSLGYIILLPFKYQIRYITEILRGIQRKYPEDHEVWRKLDKEKIVKTLLENLRYCVSKIKINEDEKEKIKKITNYPWLTEFIKNKLTSSDKRDYEFEEILKQLDEKFYSLVIKNRRNSYLDCQRFILSGEAWRLLKTDKSKVLADLENYVSVCQDLLRLNRRKGARAAKKFIRCLKQHNEISQVIDQCKREIKKPGSLTILLLLKEEEDDRQYDNIIKQLLPPDMPDIDVWGKNDEENYMLASYVLTAINASNFPMELDLWWEYYKYDYEKLLMRSIFNYGRRVPPQKALKFADRLVFCSPLLRNHAVLLVFEVASYNQLQNFIRRIWNEFHDSSIDPVIMYWARERFTDEPCEKSWALMKMCIEELQLGDFESLNNLVDTGGMSSEYGPLYLTTLLDTVEKLADNDIKNQKWKEKCIVEILSCINSELGSFMTKKVIMDILKRYYFRAESVRISKAACAFAKSALCRSQISF